MIEKNTNGKPTDYYNNIIAEKIGRARVLLAILNGLERGGRSLTEPEISEFKEFLEEAVASLEEEDRTKAAY
jgi:hypothetical protein